MGRGGGGEAEGGGELVHGRETKIKEASCTWVFFFIFQFSFSSFSSPSLLVLEDKF